jgi:4-amino-4-deoxy-L-arabinose transferase-like glycosyltransferase
MVNNKVIIKDLTIIISISFILRIVYLFFFNDPFNPFINDSKDYYDIAIHAKENGIINWQNHRRPPLISLLIIPFIKIFDEALLIILIRLFMIFLSVLTCIALYFLSLEITKNNKTSLITAIAYCLYPLSIFFSKDLLTENLSSLLVCLVSIFFIKFINEFNFKNLFIASFLMGLLSLTRSSFQYLPFFLCIVILFVNKQKLSKFLYIISILMTFYITLSPWIIKNYKQLNEFVPATSRLGLGLYLSNNDFSDKVIMQGGYKLSTEKKQFIKNLRTKYNDPIKISDILRKKSFKEINENKLAFIKASIFRIINLYNPKPNPYTSFKLLDLVMIFFYLPILLIFFASLFKKSYSFNEIILLAIILYNTLIHIPFYGIPRFRISIDSLIFIKIFIYLFKLYFDFFV